MTKEYYKLVRDKIPEKICKEGGRCRFETVSGDGFHAGFHALLVAKLHEEVAEYCANFDVMELADVLEVVFAIAKARGFTEEELQAYRRQKAERNGMFEKRIFLKSVEFPE